MLGRNNFQICTHLLGQSDRIYDAAWQCSKICILFFVITKFPHDGVTAAMCEYDIGNKCQAGEPEFRQKF